MNYLNLLRELSEQYVIRMESGHANGDWTILLGRYELQGDTDASAFWGFEMKAQGHGKTPEEAIRAAYLIVNPIPKSNRTGKLSQG